MTGSLGSLVQGSAASALQSLGAKEVKDLADGIRGDNATQDTVRAMLQSVVGCAGAAAGSSGSCGSAAIGAAASVVIGNFLSGIDRTPKDANGDGVIDRLSSSQQQARVALADTIIGTIVQTAGFDVGSAGLAAQIEGENNETLSFTLRNGAKARISDGANGEGMTVAQLIATYVSTEVTI